MFVLYTDYRYHWNERLTGLALAAIGVGSTVVSALLIRQAIKRFGEERTFFLGTFFGISGLAIYAMAPNTALFMVGTPLISLWGLANPCMQSMMSQRVSPSEQGQLQGAVNSLFGIAGMIAPLLFTGAFAYAISPEKAVAFPGIAYWMATAMLMGTFAIVWHVVRKQHG